MTARRRDESLATTWETDPDVVVGLIQQRERQRDDELAHLDHQAAQLMNRVHRLAQARLRAEVACFKDVVALHRTGRR